VFENIDNPDLKGNSMSLRSPALMKISGKKVATMTELMEQGRLGYWGS
jgi:hypothetical protein